MTALSAHFTLEEAVLSQTAARLGIPNDPDLNTVRNMKQAALGMELVRLELGGLPININSWYRSQDLERDICRDAYAKWCLLKGKPKNDETWAEYFATKAHPTGFAIDFTCPKYGSPEKIVRAIKASNIQYQQLILEFPDSGGWAHISFNGLKRQTLIIDKQGTRAF